jgi:hypothetical protein
MVKMKILPGILIAIVVFVFVLSCEPAEGNGNDPDVSAPTLSLLGNVTLIGNHEPWKYNDGGTNLFGNQKTDFRSKGFDDSAWASGNSPFGYPATESIPATFGPVSGGTTLAVNAGTPHSIYCFRKTFTVNDVAAIKSLTVSTAVDDGYVLYLNGHEIKRVNMTDPQEPKIAYTVPTTPAAVINQAGSAAGSSVWDATAFKPYLVAGPNVLAAHVHNSDNDVYFGLSLTAGLDESLVKTGPDAKKTPRQVNVHLGENAASEVIVSYTTLNADTAKIVVAKKGTLDSKTFFGEVSRGTDNKYFHRIPVHSLEADTKYTYAVGNETTFTGEFKTGPVKGSKQTIKFVYLADTQVDFASDAKGLGATLAEVANMAPDFVYLAGDITDSTVNIEEEWQGLFENDGQFGRGGETMFRNYAIAVIQGNHDYDNDDLFHHYINTPAQAGKVVYAFDYGPVTFIMLNLETAGDDASAQAVQEAFLYEKVPEAKSRGQWVMVGFHKSLYTGASHIVDDDIIAARKFWCPKLADLDVDFVLQGHDHVYSRGFIRADGSRAFENTVAPNSTVADPANAPLYMVGGHAGGRKWHSRINYTAKLGQDDPLMDNYAFLDVNSAKIGDGINSNSGKSSTLGSDIAREQVIVEMEVSQNQVLISCWMFKYDQEIDVKSRWASPLVPFNNGTTGIDAIITPKYLYDKLTVTR